MQDLGPLFVPPSEPDRFWLLILLTSVPVIAAAVVVLVRGRLPDALSSSALLLLPIMTYVLGDLHLMEESKNVDFCGSCHETMAPILAAMRSEDGDLAGRHYRRGAVSHGYACYQCHSGYGIWGGFRAKLAGATHMVHTLISDYDFPLHLHEPLNIDSCLDCHAGAVPFRAVEIHQDPRIQEALLAREMGCTGSCHPRAHPERALFGSEAWAKEP